MIYPLRNIPEDLWHRFKVLCAEESVSVREKIQELIEDEIQSKTPPIKKVRKEKIDEVSK